jgi:hypothetical protein
MRRGLVTLLSLAALAPTAGAQTIDRAKIRQAIELPSVNSVFGVHFRSNERDGKGNKLDAVTRLADLQKKLTGSPEDAEVLLEMRGVYVDLDPVKYEKKALELVQKADVLLRPILQTSDAKQGHLLTVYGTVLQLQAEHPWHDCEKWARRAVSVSPQDWRTWAYLAHARHQQLPTILCGGDDRHLPKDRRTQEVVGSLYLGRFRAELVGEAEKTLNEVMQYHDKARDLAPNEPRRQELRYAFRLSEIILRNGIASARQQKQPYRLGQFEPHIIDELRELARLHPEHVLFQSQLAHQLILRPWRESALKDGKPTRSPPNAIDLKSIREAQARIEKLAERGQGDAAVYCYTALAALHALMQEHAAVEQITRKILQIERDNQSAWEQLQQSLLLQNRKADLQQVALAQKDTLPTARSHYLLAKAYAVNGRLDLAEQACREGLKRDATDFYCLLGMSALTLCKGDSKESLQGSAQLLDLARRECPPDAGAAKFAEVEYVAAIHQALSGEPAFARIKLERLKADDPENARYDRMLAVLGR